MEDSANQPLMADASLYNGQPTDTGSSCPSARLTSCTPSIQNNKDGVSVENVLDANKQWFVLRVSYGRIIKAKAFIEAKGLECYVPLRYKEVRKHGKKRIITEPLLSSFLFVYATAEQVETLLHDPTAKNALENGNGVAWANDNTEVIAFALQNKGYTVGISELGNKDTIAPAVSKGNDTLLDWVNEEIKSLGDEQFFHKDYEETLVDTYGKDYEEELVVEGGAVQ